MSCLKHVFLTFGLSAAAAILFYYLSHVLWTCGKGTPLPTYLHLRLVRLENIIGDAAAYMHDFASFLLLFFFLNQLLFPQ